MSFKLKLNRKNEDELQAFFYLLDNKIEADYYDIYEDEGQQYVEMHWNNRTITEKILYKAQPCTLKLTFNVYACLQATLEVSHAELIFDGVDVMTLEKDDILEMLEFFDPYIDVTYKNNSDLNRKYDLGQGYIEGLSIEVV